MHPAERHGAGPEAGAVNLGGTGLCQGVVTVAMFDHPDWEVSVKAWIR